MKGSGNKKKSKMNNLRRKEALYGYLFISPWIVGFLALFLRPLISSVKYAFSKVTFTPQGVTTAFVGLENFRSPFSDAYFIPKTFAPGISSFWYEASLVCIFSLFIALLLNQKFRGRTLRGRCFSFRSSSRAALSFRFCATMAWIRTWRRRTALCSAVTGLRCC